jgi:hypothetical protein
MDVFNEHGRWQRGLPEQLKRLQDLRCPYCSRQKAGTGALLAPACGRTKCKERAAINFGLPFQLHCVLLGMAMGYNEDQIPHLILREKPKVDANGKTIYTITIHAIKEYRKLISRKLGLPNKDTVLVAWYIARAQQ